MDVKKDALKFALQNAVQFDGKANPGAVIGKLLSQNPELKSDMKNVAKEVNSIIKDISKLSVDEQKQKLLELAPQLLEKKKVEKRTLKDLPNAVMGKVVTRIPPEPSKYPHAGHALSFLINYMYAEKYKGKCIVRFEDTNPALAKQEYVDAINEGLDFLKVKAKKIFVSDDMKLMYDAAEKLIKQNQLYVCFCPAEKMSELRKKGEPCNCRVSTGHLKEWKHMKKGKYEEGKAVVRLMGDMQSKNYAMRDPVMFRISNVKHYRHGTSYKVWPLYDFENAFEDGHTGVTHILRSLEFGKMRIELQDHLKKLLGFPAPTTIQYGRFTVADSITQGRQIRDMIEDGQIKDWDDPRLVTIKALERRGILLQALKDLAVEVGLSKTETKLDWDMISSYNRKYLDASSKRYFFIDNARKVTINKAPKQKVKLKTHPDTKTATRAFSTDTDFYIADEDINSFQDGETIRLMDCLNFTKQNGQFEFSSLSIEDFKAKGRKIIHWLPFKEVVECSILMPDATVVEGYAEKNISEVKKGEVVQFTRFGFCKKEGKNRFIYAHK